MSKRTPLYQKHLESGAKLVDFSGWQMPINYGSQLDEHNFVRTDAGVFDVAHMLTVDFTGTEIKKFFRYLLANDIDKIKPGKAIYSCMLNKKAGVVDDLILYYISDDFIRLVINAGNRDSDVAWIKENAEGFDVNIKVRDDLAILAIQGPNAREKTNTVLGEDIVKQIKDLKPFTAKIIGKWMIARTGYTGEDGYEISMPQADAPMFWDKLLEEGVKPCGLGARDTLRLEAGMNLYGQDMDQKISPVEAGLMWTVSLTENRDFIGKAALLEILDKKDNFDFVGLVLEGKGILRHGQTLKADDSEKEGLITSGTFSPTLKESVAFARVPKGAQSVLVKIRNKEVPAKVVKYPFVRKGKRVYS